jgi:hypothetical protein
MSIAEPAAKAAAKPSDVKAEPKNTDGYAVLVAKCRQI